MPMYEVEGPDGKLYDVEGPKGASDAQVISAVRRQLRKDARETRKKDIAAAYATPLPEKEEEKGSLLGDILQSPFAGAVGLYGYIVTDVRTQKRLATLI